MLRILRAVFSKISDLHRTAPCEAPSIDGLSAEFWIDRARRYGKRAVLNLDHGAHEYENITSLQKDILYPYFKTMVDSSDKTVLDYGCGPGRFTPDLAVIVGGKAIGVDVIQNFLDMAPRSERVEYRLMRDREIPCPDGSADIVWVCHVLGHINGSALAKAVTEIDRVLAARGLLFLVECTSARPPKERIIFRSVDEYTGLFPFVSLAHLHDYLDLGETISLLAGRRSGIG